jgi:hypothetical protein
MNKTLGMLLLAVSLVSSPASAVPFVQMFEQDSDAGANEELIFRTYSSLENLLGNIDPDDTASPIDISSTFSSTGLTWDGSRYIVAFEREDDAGASEELIFRTYSSLENLFGNIDPDDTASPIDISSAFSSTGLTWDGSRYILAFEREDDAGANEELIFRTYSSFENLISNLFDTDFVSPIDISSAFSSTGLTWDGSRYIVAFERDDDAGANEELIFRAYSSLENLFGNIDPDDTASPINISSVFSSTGLMALVDFDSNPPSPVPGPSTLALVCAAFLAGLLRIAVTGVARLRRV